MIKNYLIGLTLIFISTLAYAESCPSVANIKKNALNGWQFYDTEEGTVLSATRIAEYKNRIQQFALAEWENVNNKNNVMHCYYLDADGSNLNAYLAKNNFHPDRSLRYWYKVTGSVQCTAGMNKCKFQQLANKQSQLAEKKSGLIQRTLD